MLMLEESETWLQINKMNKQTNKMYILLWLYVTMIIYYCDYVLLTKLFLVCYY